MNILSFLKQKKKSSEPEKDEESVDASVSTGSLTDFIALHASAPSLNGSENVESVPKEVSNPSENTTKDSIEPTNPSSNSAMPTLNNSEIPTLNNSDIPTLNKPEIPTLNKPEIPTSNSAHPSITPSTNSALPIPNSALPTSNPSLDPSLPSISSSIDVSTAVSSSSSSHSLLVDSLLTELTTRMQSYHQAALARCAQLHAKGRSIASITTQSAPSGVSSTHPSDGSLAYNNNNNNNNDANEEDERASIEMEQSEEEAEMGSEEAVIEDTATNDAEILDVAPSLIPVESIQHEVLNLDKSTLTSSELFKLPYMIGFRYIHPDTETPRRRIFFGISHKVGHFATGRTPLSREERVNYDDDSEEEEDLELFGEEPQGDDCNDTESESGESESGTQLDYRDGFLEEEDINIGDGNLTAEEKSALVFRSVSGNKGKRGESAGLWGLNQPFVLAANEEAKMGIDLRTCRGILIDPDFFVETVETMRKKKMELVEEVEVKRKVNITEEMVKTMSEIIAGQQLTISQVVEWMQKRYPGLPKRQIESKLHEIAEKKKKVWVIRSPPLMKMMVDIDNLMMTHGVESSPIKRTEAENNQTETPQKRIRIHTEKIPDRTILHGNISNSAFALDPHDEGPSNFLDVKPSCVVCFYNCFRARISYPHTILLTWISFGNTHTGLEMPDLGISDLL